MKKYRGMLLILLPILFHQKKIYIYIHAKIIKFPRKKNDTRDFSRSHQSLQIYSSLFNRQNRYFAKIFRFTFFICIILHMHILPCFFRGAESTGDARTYDWHVRVLLFQIRDKKVKAAEVVAARLPAVYSRSPRWSSPTWTRWWISRGWARGTDERGLTRALSHGF